ncbi:MAG: MarR family transcriptional regulator [bacterium]|nr:MarR family transcriptional regulator [bacterium]
MKDPNVDIPIEFKVPAHEALMNIWWTGTLLKRAARRFFRNTPFSEAEFNLLVVLRHSEAELSQKDLSARLLVDKSNITGLIDRLEKAGLIARNAVPGDRRRYHITLTAEGRRRIDQVDPVYHEMVEQVMSGLDEREYRQLIRLTRKVRQGMARAV